MKSLVLFCSFSYLVLLTAAAEFSVIAGLTAAAKSGLSAEFWYKDSFAIANFCQVTQTHSSLSLLSLTATEDNEIEVTANYSQLTSIQPLYRGQWELVKILICEGEVQICVGNLCKQVPFPQESQQWNALSLQCDRGIDKGIVVDMTTSLPQCKVPIHLKAPTPCALRTYTLTSTTELQIDFTNLLIFDYNLPTGENICYGVNPNRSYPDFTEYDPIPTIDRGIYIGRLNFASMLWIGGLGNPVIYGQGLTIEMWVAMRVFGTLFQLYYVQSDFSYILAEIDIYSDKHRKMLKFSFRDAINPSTTIQIFTNLEIDMVNVNWALIGFSLGYDSDKTRITVFVNNYSESRVVGQAYIPAITPWWKFGNTGKANIYRIYVTKREKSMGEIVQHIANYAGCIGPTGLSKCLPTCDLNYYVDATGQCLPCLSTCQYGCVRPTDCSLCADPLCYRCSSFSGGSCSECVTNASFVSGQCTCNSGTFQFQGQCVFNCPDGYYRDGSMCKMCTRGCVSCNEEKCLKCSSTYFWIDGLCTCEVGLYITTDSQCEKCEVPCASCQDEATKCTDCLTSSGYVLLSYKCIDCTSITGYMGGLGVDKQPPNLSEKDTINAVCKEICGDGLTMGQLECDDGNLIDGDGCSSKCEIEEGWDCTIPILGGKSVCVDIKPPTGNLTYVQATNDGFQLMFSISEDVTMTDSLEANSGISIETVDLFDYSISQQFPLQFQVTITMYQSVKKGQQLTLTILHPEYIKDARNNSLGPSVYTTTLSDSFSVKSTVTISKAMTGVSASLSLSASSSIMTSLFGGTPLNLLWSLLEALQIINYLVFMSAILPANLRSFLRALNFANFQFIPNLFGSDDDFESPPFPFVYEDVSTGFLANCGNIITIWLSIMALFAIIYILARLLPASSLLQKVKGVFVYSVFLRNGLETFLQLTLAVLLQLRSPVPGSTADTISLCVGVIVTLLLLSLVGLLILSVVVKPVETLKNAEYKRKFGSLYSSFSLKMKVARSFLVFQLLRKFVFVCFLVFMSKVSLAQSISIAALNFLFTASLAAIRPYKRHLAANNKEIISESLLTLSLVIISVLSMDLSISTRDTLGWVVISLLLAMIALHFFALFRSQYIAVRRLFAKWNAAIAERKRGTQSDRTESLLESEWNEKKSRVVPMREHKEYELEVVTTQPVEQTFQAEEDSKPPMDHFRPRFKK